MLKKVLFCMLVVLMSFDVTSQAQTRKQKVKGKSSVKADKKTTSNAIYNEMLGSTAKIMIIDSVVTDKSNFLDKIPLNKESGFISSYDKFWKTTGQPNSFVYMNEFGNKVFYSKTGADGHSQLYTADKLNGQWQNQKLITDFGSEFEDINYPFMLSDGVTLYFSAKGKDNLGGYDLYVTRFDADSSRFYKPENIGMPYNSTANDYFCIIDDFDSLGWLVTDHHQPEGKVCIYTFVPSSARNVYDVDNIGEAKLKALAEIRSIKDTWTDKTALEAANARLSKLLQRNKERNAEYIFFVVNDNTVYTSLADFKTDANRQSFKQLLALKKQNVDTENQLESYRKKYTEGNAYVKRQLSGQIVKLEQLFESGKTKAAEMEKHIRNSENLTNQ